MNWRQQANGRRAELFLALVTAAALAPFLHRAFDIDEPLFLWMAQQIAKHPLDPYGFDVNWASLWQPMWNQMHNPPLCSYYIAVVASIFGWSEIALHAAFLPLSIGAILGTFALARRLCDFPATAALLTLFTPLFLISASSIMCDVMLMAFWVWAIELWFRALESNKHWIFASSAALIMAATFTKYFGISLVPLLLIYTVVRRDREVRFRLWYLAIPLLAVLVYEGVTKARYGAPLFTNAMIFLQHSAEAAKIPLSTSFLTGCSFLGGCLVSAFFFVRSRRVVIVGILLCLGTTILFRLFVARDGTFAVQLQGGLFAALGTTILGLAFYQMAKKRDAESLLLLLWILGGFGFAAFLNWSITARTILPILPAIMIVVMRVCHAKSAGPPAAIFTLAGRLACAAAISLFVTYTDYRQANASRKAAHHFRQKLARSGSKVWFQGHWGFQWYMQQWNAEPITKTAQFLPGDFMIIPSNNIDPMAIPRESVVSLEQHERHLFPFATTFAPGTGAGFYSNARGPVPWLVGRVPVQRWEAVVFK